MALYQFEGHKPQVTQGAFIAESALVIGDVQIEKDTYIGHGAILRGDYGTIIVGEGTAIEEGVIVHARPNDRTIFGKYVTVGHGSMIHNAYIGDYAVIGMRSTISDYSVVGEWTIIGEIMPNSVEKIDGKKFMWDKGNYSTEAEAKEKMALYENDGFETQLVEEEGKYLVYSRRIVTEIVLEDGGQAL